MATKKTVKEPETVIEEGIRKFVTCKVEVKNHNGITMFRKDERVAVVRDFGKTGVNVKNPLESSETWRLFNHELKGQR